MKFLDLDAVHSDVEFTIKLKGKEHKLREATVEDFIVNAKAIENLTMNASPTKELEITMQMVKRSFPTVSDEDLNGLTFSQLKAIADYAREANGEVAEKQDEAESEGNAEAANK